MTEESTTQDFTQDAVAEMQNPAPPATPELTLNDLAALRSILEVASQRGAFKANEFEAVGKTFNKLNTFLEAVAATAAKKEE